ncbi:MAG: cytochrome b5 domain-containing protein [Chloroflexota bacterium]
MTDRIFTVHELRLYNGEDRPQLYIAYRGIVYDVTECPRWRRGMHERIHFPGQDLSGEIEEAPHAEDVFARPCVKIVGKLQ